MGASVGGVGCCGKFNGVVELVEEKFDRLGRIVGRFHACVVVDEIGRRDVSVGIVDMAENSECSHVCEAGDAVAKGAVVDVIDGGEKLLLERFVGDKYSFQMRREAACCRVSSAMNATVALSGRIGLAPGFAGGKK